MMYDGLVKDVQVLWCYCYVAFFALLYVYIYFHWSQEKNVRRCEFCGEESEDVKMFKCRDLLTGEKKWYEACRSCRMQTVMAETILKKRKEI